MKKGYVYIGLAAVLFSTMEIALKVVSGQFNPLQITLLRFTIGSLVLLPMAIAGLKRRGARLGARDVGFFALTGFICVVVSMILYQVAIQYSQAAVVAILFSCNPLFVVLFARPLLGEKISRTTAVSIAVSLSGILVIAESMRASGSLLGTVLTILSAVAFALYGVVGRTRSDRFGGVAMTCMSFLLGAAELLAVALLTAIPRVARGLSAVGLGAFANVSLAQGISLHTLPYLAYIGIFVTGLGYTFYFLAMEETSAATASVAFFIKPALAPILALLLLHEEITAPMIVGIVLMVAGSLVSFAAAKRGGERSPAPTVARDADGG